MQSRHSAISAIAAATAALLAAAVPQAAAQNFPERQIRLIVPLAPGGGNDAAARVIATELGKRFNQQVIVDNKPGGGSII
ncbi:MAG: tripartite tricarboxylate transporter substrate binding protein, partial [Burkholderiales bacterium]|nr:tripartite tricarboxylate transporter substrate binding protein [Burkholderiales bacterium]